MNKLLSLMLVIAMPCPADGLTDLQGILVKLQGTEAIRARADIQRWSKEGEGKKARTKQSHCTIQIEDGPSGLRLGWTPQQIAGARKEALAKITNPDAETPNLDALSATGGISATGATDCLCHGDYLLQLVSGATVLEDRADSYLGHPSRLLVLKLNPTMNAEEKSMVKNREERLKVWLDDHGIPVGTEHTMALKASKFLITFTVNNRQERKLAVVGNRLVVQSETHEDSGSGMGFSNTSKKVTSLTFF